MTRTRKSRVRESLKNMTASPTSNTMPTPGRKRVGRPQLPKWRRLANNRFAQIMKRGLPVMVWAHAETQQLRVRELRPHTPLEAPPDCWVVVGTYARPFDGAGFLADVGEVFAGRV